MKASIAKALAVVSVLALDACDSCADHDQRVARLAQTDGKVQRDFAARNGRWQSAAAGADFEVGDGLRTGKGARAELDLLPSGRLRVEAQTVVRFARTPPGKNAEPRVELEAGAIELEAVVAELEITSAQGRARITPGSRMHVRSAQSGVTFAVDVGRVLLEQDGHTRELRGGDSFVLEVGALSVEPSNVAPPPVAVDAGATPAAAEEAAAAPAEFDTPPARADFELPAGESAIVHDPGPPTHVRIVHAGCDGGMAVEVARASGAHVTRVRGEGGGIVALPPGQFRYRVRCALPGAAPSGRPAADGRLQIVRDAATRKLKMAPPAVTVAADGRRYTVRYQNLLPQLALHWPGAPAASSYVLTLRAGGKALLRESAPSPQVILASGRIEEGTYGFRFEAGGTHSAESTLSIVFDDTARVAYLSEPRENAFAAGANVRVAGAALHGAQVRAEGRPLPVHGHGRFDGEVVAPADRSALAVRVQHAATGVHYFLRHAAEAAE
jgi:hypothetical protein